MSKQKKTKNQSTPIVKARVTIPGSKGEITVEVPIEDFVLFDLLGKPYPDAELKKDLARVVDQRVVDQIKVKPLAGQIQRALKALKANAKKEGA